MVNRKKTLEMMSSIPARMEQIRYEAKKHGGVLPVEDQIYKPTSEIDKDYIKKHYDLIKRVTPGPLDTPFDQVTRYRTYIAIGPSFTPVAGTQMLLWEYKVPAGSRLIINGFCFWADVWDAPVVNYPVFAEPMEFFGLFNFVILVNGRLPGDITYATQNPNIRSDGWTILSKDIERDSLSNLGGTTIPCASGSKIQVFFRNGFYAYAVGIRQIRNVGFRLRGFLSPVNPEEK